MPGQLETPECIRTSTGARGGRTGRQGKFSIRFWAFIAKKIHPPLTYTHTHTHTHTHIHTHYPSKRSYCCLTCPRKESGHGTSLIQRLWDQLQMPPSTYFLPSATATSELKACGSGGRPAISLIKDLAFGYGAAAAIGTCTCPWGLAHPPDLPPTQPLMQPTTLQEALLGK
jgi:hypothetical protein